MDNNTIKCGQHSYGSINVYRYSPNDGILRIGNYCSIADNVTFLLGGGHDYKKIVSFPVNRRLMNEGFSSISKGDIVLKDDVWIGFGAIVLSGITIGQGSVIGAGCVVSKDVPPYAVVVGSPMRIIKYRFSDEIIHFLLSIDFSNISKETMIKLYSINVIDDKNINDIKELINNDKGF